MTELIAFCGLDCATCQAYIAAQNDDDEARAVTAEAWSHEYHANIRAEDINCDGCASTSGRLVSHCNICEIRQCGLGKGLANCAHCDDFACERLAAFFEMVPDARQRLEAVRAAL